MPVTGDYLYSVLKEADGSLSLQTPEQWSSRTVYTEASLNYDRSFGAHRVGGLLLYNQKVYWDLNATDVIGGMPYKQRGFAGRATYSWNDRYFAEFNLGINGSENFSPGKRYGVFPAFGLGWAVSNESFWNPVRKYISFLKFRYTDGWVGSDTATGRRFMYQGVFTGLTGTMFGTKAKGTRYLEMAEGYVTRMGLDEDGEVIGYEFIHLGKVTDMLKKGIDPKEAVEKATGSYGRFADAVKYIDPRQE